MFFDRKLTRKIQHDTYLGSIWDGLTAMFSEFSLSPYEPSHIAGVATGGVESSANLTVVLGK